MRVDIDTNIEGLGLHEIHARILEALRASPGGLSITELRLGLGVGAGEQQHLDRRVRQLDPHFDIKRVRRGRDVAYVLHGRREGSSPLSDLMPSKTVRARVLHLHGCRCQMCGRSASEPGVRLHIDHRVPRDWGGDNSEENLWPLCSECNEGKRNFFASIADPRIRRAMLHSSVHVRLGELLKGFTGQEVPKEYLAIVGSPNDDWEKRLRELRELGWRYTSKRRRVPSGRTKVWFILEHWEEWPEGDIAEAIRLAERARGLRR